MIINLVLVILVITVTNDIISYHQYHLYHYHHHHGIVITAFARILGKKCKKEFEQVGELMGCHEQLRMLAHGTNCMN